MTDPRSPAAYICVARTSGAHALSLRRHAIAETARQRGWPALAVYADEDDPSLADGGSSALAVLIAAIRAGRHDALIISGLDAISGGPAYLLPRLLFPCTDHGVAVEFLTPPATAHSAFIPAPAAMEQPAPVPRPVKPGAGAPPGFPFFRARFLRAQKQLR